MRSTATIAIFAFLIVDTIQVTGAEQSPKLFTDSIQPVLTKYCVDCHGPDVTEASFRVDQLPQEVSTAEQAQRWASVLDKLETGEMPPKDVSQPLPNELELVKSWIDATLTRDAARRSEVTLRRLNRLEYNHTVSDLLGIDFHHNKELPDDEGEEGFNHLGDKLQTSPELMRVYLDVADSALDKALWFGPPPERLHKKFATKEQLGYTEDPRLLGSGAGFETHNGHMVILSYWSRQEISADLLGVKTSGNYRIRIKAYSIRSPDEKQMLQVKVGAFAKQDTVRDLGFEYLKNGEPIVVERIARLNPRESIRFPWLNGKAHNNAAAAARREGTPYAGPGVVVEWIEVEGPLFLDEGWPKKSHRMTIGIEQDRELGRDDIKPIIEYFAGRAFRRPALPEDTQPIVEFVQSEFDNGASMQEAIRTGLKTTLCSPKFLFMYETEEFDDWMLASRLSYFLWRSMPDEELLHLAAAGKLSNPSVLRDQAERMLKDAKAQRFVSDFAHQWLDLNLIGEMQPDKAIYPKYSNELEASLASESTHFFAEVLKQNLSIDNFVHSDFLMINQKLAEHYGIDGVEGTHFRPVLTPPDSHRGGVLTHASVLAVTANGTNTSPVLRGAWISTRLLGQKPPPPPADIPVVVPDIRGTKTIREQLAKHRSVQSCNSCHRKIDPLGFALENFDAIGQWRTQYRVRKGPDGRGGWFGDGPEVIPADTLASGQSFENIDELKKILLSDYREEFHRAFAQRMMTYGVGRELAWTDRSTLNSLTRRLAKSEYGLRDLIVGVVLSPQFSSP